MITINDVNVYTFEEMMKPDLSENELYDLFETPSLHYSITIEMFKMVNNPRTPEEVIEFCKTDPRWMYKTLWEKEDRELFLEKLTKLFMSLYSYGEEKAKSSAEWWIFWYGMSQHYKNDEKKQKSNKKEYNKKDNNKNDYNKKKKYKKPNNIIKNKNIAK